MNGDEYMALLLERQAEYMEQQQHRDPRVQPRPWVRPLLEWFIRPGDEELFTPPPASPCPKPPRPAPQPRRYTPASVLRDRRAGLQAKLDAIVCADVDTDPAVVNISPSSSKRHIARAGRRRFAKMDRDLAKVGELRRRISALDSRIARAESREGKA